MTSSASRVPVMCSEFIARTVRTAVPRRRAGLGPVPGGRPAGVPPGPADGRPPRAPRRRRPAARRVRQPPRRSQGAGRADRGDARIRERVPQATLVIVGGGPYEERLRALAADAPAGSVLFAGQVSEEDLPRYYARGRRLRDAVPHAPRRHGGRGLGQRVHRGVGVLRVRSSSAIPAAPARRSSTARRACSWTAPTSGRSPTPSRSCSPIRIAPGGWVRRARARVERAHAWPRDRRPPRRVVARRRRLGELHRSGTWCGGTLPPWPRRHRPTPKDAAPSAARSSTRAQPGAGCASNRSYRGRARSCGGADAEEPDPEPVEEPHELGTEPATDQPERRPTASSPDPHGGSDPGAGHDHRGADAPGWPCAVCGTRNPIESDFCETCGASFASLMRQETVHIKVDPQGGVAGARCASRVSAIA